MTPSELAAELRELLEDAQTALRRNCGGPSRNDKPGDDAWGVQLRIEAMMPRLAALDRAAGPASEDSARWQALKSAAELDGGLTIRKRAGSWDIEYGPEEELVFGETLDDAIDAARAAQKGAGR